MTRDDIIRLAREAGFIRVVAIEEGGAVTTTVAPIEELERFAALIAAAEREKLAQWMISKGYSTGHGDTTEDLLKELEWQIAEFVDKAAAALDLLERHTVTIDGEFGYCRSIGELESAGALPQEIVNLRRAIARMTEGRL